MCLALESLHQRRVLHRDLKTQNIFLTSGKLQQDGEVRIGDFGLAKQETLNHHIKPQSDEMKKRFEIENTSNVGTPFYLAPELVANLDESSSDLNSSTQE